MALIDLDVVTLALRAGFEAFVGKPSSSEELLKMVGEVTRVKTLH